MNKLIKLVLTLLLVCWAAMPYVNDTNSDNALDALLRFGIAWSVVIFSFFFGMVALYCRTLQKCLELIKPENRRASPTSVWYMFLIPFNFIEDFCIVINLSHSIEKEARSNPKLAQLNDFGMVTGIGWSLAQVLSFIPTYLGQVAGIVGFMLVLVHWALIVKVNRLLTN